jgi:hypothetical protein
MRDINDLRHTFDAETADLAVDIPPDLIRRRARGLRVRRATLTAAVGVLAAAALALPAVELFNGSSLGYHAAGQESRAPCLKPSPDDGYDTSPSMLGPLVETSVTFDAPNVNTRYDVLLGLDGPRDMPAFLIAFKDRNTLTIEAWDSIVLHRSPNGEFSGKQAGDFTHQFQTAQLILGPNSVLDVGLYSGAADRITVASEGHATDAGTARNAATGWTFFWAQRAAAPLPPAARSSAEEYHGPEQLTINAYDAAGRLQHTVTGGHFVGLPVQNPRDNQPSNQEDRLHVCLSAGTPDTVSR